MYLRRRQLQTLLRELMLLQIPVMTPIPQRMARLHRMGMKRLQVKKLHRVKKTQRTK